MNGTLEKFGYPHRLVLETEHWAALLRPQQATLGALVLGSKSDATAFADLPPEAFTELADVTRALETALRASFGYDRINYLMLMMVDPEVHFHVLPRYGEAQTFEGHRFEDAGWPGPPDLSPPEAIPEAVDGAILARIRQHIP